MKRVCFAYVVQCDIPGHPIKVGCSKAPRIRYASSLGHTPADLRLLGITIDGKAREAELKAALASTVIRGEWGLPNPEFAALIRRWFDAGEWYEPVEDHRAHMIATNVAERVGTFRGYRISGKDTQSIGLHWTGDLLEKASQRDPTLGLDWNGFVPATRFPDLRGLDHNPRLAA